MNDQVHESVRFSQACGPAHVAHLQMRISSCDKFQMHVSLCVVQRSLVGFVNNWCAFVGIIGRRRKRIVEEKLKSVLCDCCLGFTTSQSARTFQCETQLEMSARRQRRKPLGSQASVISSEWAASCC